MWRAIINLFCLCLTPPSAAQEWTIVAEEDHAAWNALGQVNQAGFNSRSICTGTLIAPNVVLTAAHCTDGLEVHPTEDKPLHFIAGWNRGNYAAHRLVDEIARNPAYRSDRSGVAHVVTDMALLRLKSPIEDVAPMPLGHPNGTAPYFAGYRHDRRHAITLYSDCNPRFPMERLLIMGCQAVGGNSGSPALVDEAEGPMVVGVVVAAAPGRAYAALIGDWVRQVLDDWDMTAQ